MANPIKVIIRSKLEAILVDAYIEQLKKIMKNVEFQVVQSFKIDQIETVMDVVRDIQRDFLSSFSLSDQRLVMQGIISSIIHAYEEKIKANVHPRGWQSPNLNTYWVRTGTTKKSIDDKIKTYKRTGGFTIFGAIGSLSDVTFNGLVKFRRRYNRTGYKKKIKRTTYYYFARLPKRNFKLKSRTDLVREQKLAANRRVRLAFKRNRMFRVFNRSYSGFMRKVVKTEQKKGRKYKAKSIWYARRLHKPYKIFHILEKGRKAVGHFGPFPGYHYAEKIYTSFQLDVHKHLSAGIDKILEKLVKKLKATLKRQQQSLLRKI